MMGMITDLRLVQKPANLLQYVIKTSAYLLKICLLMQRGILDKEGPYFCKAWSFQAAPICTGCSDHFKFLGLYVLGGLFL